jgi:hypothetical protein
MKTLNDVSLYDVMAQDLDVWVTKDKKFGFTLEVDGENGEELIRESGLHPCATDSFADFCRRFLSAYDNANKSEAA